MMDQVEIIARELCWRSGRDPDDLEPGNVVCETYMDEEKFRCADYDHLFDDGTIPPDGHNGKDNCHFAWRGHIFTAQAVLRVMKEMVGKDNPK